METHVHHKGWTLAESGPAGADQAVLLLPGALCTGTFYDDVLASPKLSGAPIRFVAATVPGHGRTEPPDRQDVLIAELKKNDPRFLRRQTRRYLEYLDRHGSLVSRLSGAGVRA